MESKKKTMRTAFVAPGKSLTVRLGIAQPGARVSPADLIAAKEEDQIALYLKLIEKKILIEKDEDKNSGIEKQPAPKVKRDALSMKVTLTEKTENRIKNLERELEALKLGLGYNPTQDEAKPVDPDPDADAKSVDQAAKLAESPAKSIQNKTAGPPKLAKKAGKKE